MSAHDLTPEDMSYLGDCRLIAAENYAFYERIYTAKSFLVDKEIVGRVMAQKKDFIDAISSLMENTEIEDVATEVPETQDLVLTLPSNDQFVLDTDSLHKFVLSHEDKFDQALRRTLENVSCGSIKELLGHHLEAARLALQALGPDEAN